VPAGQLRSKSATTNAGTSLVIEPVIDQQSKDTESRRPIGNATSHQTLSHQDGSQESANLPFYPLETRI
jgi:hypothetical protein